jgi:23S rRNA pseudouridine2605 synthase
MMKKNPNPKRRPGGSSGKAGKSPAFSVRGEKKSGPRKSSTRSSSEEGSSYRSRGPSSRGGSDDKPAYGRSSRTPSSRGSERGGYSGRSTGGEERSSYASRGPSKRTTSERSSSSRNSGGEERSFRGRGERTENAGRQERSYSERKPSAGRGGSFNREDRPPRARAAGSEDRPSRGRSEGTGRQERSTRERKPASGGFNNREERAPRSRSESGSERPFRGRNEEGSSSPRPRAYNSERSAGTKRPYRKVEGAEEIRSSKEGYENREPKERKPSTRAYSGSKPASKRAAPRPRINESGERELNRFEKKRGVEKKFIEKKYGATTNRTGARPATPKVQDRSGIRLNRYIANAGVCSRREADELIEAGEIKVNGVVITEMGYRIQAGDSVKHGNKVLSPEKLVYVLINKPKDTITTLDDPEGRKTVMEIIAGSGSERVEPVGRLDRNTTGLLLLTNDGDLAQKLTHPSNQIQKLYEVELDRPITPEDFAKLQQSKIRLHDGPVKIDEVAIVNPNRKVLGVEIHEGRNRIVRRIFEHLGYDVEKLDRVIYAGLTKKNLPRGKYRFLTETEINRLKFLI